MKHAGDVGFRATLGKDVAVGVGFDLAAKHFGVRNMADGYEEAVHFLFPYRAGRNVAQAHVGDQALFHIMDVFDHGVGHELDFGILLGPGQHDFRGAELISPVHHGDFAAKAREEIGFLHS